MSVISLAFHAADATLYITADIIKGRSLLAVAGLALDSHAHHKHRDDQAMHSHRCPITAVQQHERVWYSPCIALALTSALGQA